MDSKTFCENAVALIGLPYSNCDCIGVVRRAAGIRCQGTNWLWRSYTSSGKYQFLTERYDNPPLKGRTIDGTLVFRIKWNETPSGYSDKPNCHHVGILYGSDVIQSQEGKGVYRKEYNPKEWDAMGWLKQITPPSVETFGPDKPPYIDDDRIDPYEPTDHEMIKALYDKFIID